MEEKHFYIVNPKGAIHIVSETHARARLTIAGWRLATADERTAYEAQDGNQRFDKPLVAPFKPIPDDADILAGARAIPAPVKNTGAADDIETVKESDTPAAPAKKSRK